MRIGHIDTDAQVFVIAEVGNNHEGSYALAEELIGQAAEAGADAVKFQTIVPELLVRASDQERLATLRRFQLSYAQFEALAQRAQKAGIMFFSTPLDLQSARFLNEIQGVFKIASGDNNFLPLIDEIAGFGKPIILSTGLADIELLSRVKARIHDAWKMHDVSSELAFLHCVSSYPVPQSEANLGAINTLRARFPDVVVGYSDHTIGIEVSTLAVAAGARIVEKHFTVDKNYSSFRDHQLSADPADFKEMVQRIREVTQILGDGVKAPQECEQSLLMAARRSIAASADLASGTLLQREHLIWVRPGSGLPPGSEGDLLGKRTIRPIARGELIALSDVAAC